MFKNIKILSLLCLLLVSASHIANAGDKYDPEFLKRQLRFYPPEKAVNHVKTGDYLNAAIGALSIYPVDGVTAISIALALEEKIEGPLPDFLFKAFQESVLTDPSIRSQRGGKTMVSRLWMEQKAKWSDDFIFEVMAYKKLRECFNNDTKATNKFYFGAFHNYFLLDKNEATRFLQEINKDSLEYKILTAFARAVSGQPINIAELDKIEIANISDAMKEMVVTLKGLYYMQRGDFHKAKAAFLESFSLNYSLPVHTENLATCYLAIDSYDQAKPLLLHIAQLIRIDNISVVGIYNLACIFAREGNEDEALRYLEAAITRGFPKAEAKSDADLKSLSDDPRFINLIK